MLQVAPHHILGVMPGQRMSILQSNNAGPWHPNTLLLLRFSISLEEVDADDASACP